MRPGVGKEGVQDAEGTGGGWPEAAGDSRIR